MKTVTLRAALEDDNLLGSLLKGDSWARWRALLVAAMGEELTPDERALYTEVTGRDYEPGHRVGELWCLCGRRAGKSRAVSVLAAYIAAFQPHPKLVRGEVGILSILSATVRQAEVLKGYISAVFEDIPLLRRMRKAETADTITLMNNISIEIRPASFRTIRGLTLIGCLADEVCHWSSEFSANADSQILGAVRPGLSSTDGQLICISSPHARRGEGWAVFKDYYGRDDASILVANGASRTFNPTLSQAVVDRAIERDPSAAASEFLGEFRSDLESYVNAEVVDAAIEPGRYELPPVPDRKYSVFIDPAGGSGKDSFTMAVSHREGENAVLDAVREAEPPFSPDAIVEAFSRLIRS